jgi:hypothetical protein
MFDALFTEVQTPAKRFVVYARGDDGGVSERFAHHDVAVERRALPPGGPDPFLAIERDGEFVGAVGLDALEGLLEPPLVRPGDREEVSEGYRALFEVLDGTVFTGLDRRDLLAVSREIEDRAFRAGRGTLRAAFQRLSAFEAQAEVYRHLAGETDLDVHVYGVADWDPPAIPGVAYHDVDAALGCYWVLAFEGEEHCALVARAEGEEFSGFWTDDAGLAGEVAGKLEEVS